MYSTCVDNCGWGSAGIPPLASITSSCSNGNEDNGSGASNPSALPNTSSTAPQAGGNNPSSQETTTTVVITGNLPKITNSGNPTNSNGNKNSATSGVDDREDGHSLLFRLQGVVLAGVVVFWIFGWL